MVDIATPTLASRTPVSKKSHPDEETFRVAEELMLLSASRTQSVSQSTAGHYASRSAHAENQDQNSGAGTHQILRKRQKALTVQFDLLKSPQRHLNSKRHRHPIENSEEIINSRCDISHSQLLKEHRSRFVRARRRWNTERAIRHKAILDSFQVQGIPLVQHLDSLSRRR